MANTAAAGQQSPPRATDDASGPPSRPTLSGRLPHPWLFPLLVFAGTLAAIVATWHISNAIYGTHWPWTSYFIFKDAKYYLSIAEYGYRTPPLSSPIKLPFQHITPPPQAAFFPLFPALIRAASYLTPWAGPGRFYAAGFGIQVITGAASAVAVWALADRVAGRRVADRAVALYCLFPGAMTFGLLYTEPLAVALIASALLAVLARRWLLAGVLALAASAEHPTGIILAGALGIAALHAIWTRREWRSLIAPVLAPCGMLGYFAYNGRRYHDFFFWFKAENTFWDQHIDWGLHEFHMVTWTDPATAHYRFFNALIIVMFAVCVAGIAVMLAARVPVPVSVYTILLFADIVLARGAAQKPRFVLTAVGIFIGAAIKLPRWLFWPLLAVSAALLLFLVGWWPHHYVYPAP